MALRECRCDDSVIRCLHARGHVVRLVSVPQDGFMVQFASDTTVGMIDLTCYPFAFHGDEAATVASEWFDDQVEQLTLGDDFHPPSGMVRGWEDSSYHDPKGWEDEKDRQLFEYIMGKGLRGGV